MKQLMNKAALALTAVALTAITLTVSALTSLSANAASRNAHPVYAAGNGNGFTPARRAPTPRDAEVQSVKENYWNRTDDGDVEVVQNRNYSKKNRLSLQVNGGLVSSDPFLSIKSLGGAIGYHFTEDFGVSVVGRKYFVSDSSYLNDLETGLVTGVASTANVNRPNSYVGGELEWSPFYGKISLSGASIVHFDVHFLAGAGQTSTEAGSYFTPTVGVGPQFYLGNSVALRLDYRLSYYKESIPERVLVTRTTAGERDNYSHAVALGLVLYLF